MKLIASEKATILVAFLNTGCRFYRNKQNNKGINIAGIRFAIFTFAEPSILSPRAIIICGIIVKQIHRFMQFRIILSILVCNGKIYC